MNNFERTMQLAQRERERLYLKTEISRVNEILRTTKNPRTYRQEKKHLERLERKYRLWVKSMLAN